MILLSYTTCAFRFCNARLCRPTENGSPHRGNGDLTLNVARSGPHSLVAVRYVFHRCRDAMTPTGEPRPENGQTSSAMNPTCRVGLPFSVPLLLCPAPRARATPHRFAGIAELPESSRKKRRQKRTTGARTGNGGQSTCRERHSGIPFSRLRSITFQFRKFYAQSAARPPNTLVAPMFVLKGSSKCVQRTDIA